MSVEARSVASAESTATTLPGSAEAGKEDSVRSRGPSLEILGMELPRTVGVFSLMLLTYYTICAGPFGIEEAVQAAGPLPVLITVVLLAIFWGLPQSLVTAELSCLMDVNGGYIEWVSRSMGAFPAWLTAFNSMGSNICDLPLYSVLFASYFEPILTSALGYAPGWFAMYGIKLACLLVIMGLNLRGIEDVSRASGLITIVILTPFIIQAIMAGGKLNPASWVQSADPIKWSPFISTLLWNFQGFSALSSVAGEVKDSQRTYPLGVAGSLVLIVLSYIIPVVVGISLAPAFHKWDEGYLAVIAGEVAPWLGVWVGVGAMVAQIGNGLAMMASAARVVWHMSHKGMLPSFLGHLWNRYHSPAPAVLFHSVTTCFLMVFSFEALVVVDTLFNNIALLFETWSFLVLRYTEPDTYRPYTLPGGLVMAWVVTCAKSGVILFAMGTVGWVGWLAVGSCNVVFIALYFLLKRFHKKEDIAAEAAAAVPKPEGEASESSALRDFFSHARRFLPDSVASRLHLDAVELHDEENPSEVDGDDEDDDEGDDEEGEESDSISVTSALQKITFSPPLDPSPRTPDTPLLASARGRRSRNFGRRRPKNRTRGPDVPQLSLPVAAAGSPLPVVEERDWAAASHSPSAASVEEAEAGEGQGMEMASLASSFAESGLVSLRGEDEEEADEVERRPRGDETVPGYR